MGYSSHCPNHKCHNRHFLQLVQLFYSFSKKFNGYCSIFSSSLSFTRGSPGIAMSLILASFAWLSTKMMSGLLASTILSHYTLKSHRTLKTCIFFRLVCGMFVPLICPFQFRLPTQLPMHIPRYTVMSPLVLMLGYRAALTC